jgi:hypothetical protein
MTQNLIDLDFSAESLATIDAAIAALETELAPLMGLDPAQRRGLTKMGDKSEAFCRQAVMAFSEHAQVLPRNFDLAAYQGDLAALDALRPRRRRLERLQELMEHTEMALGSDLMTASLEGYAVLKVSGRSTGLDGLRQALSARFRGQRGAAPAEAIEPA